MSVFKKVFCFVFCLCFLNLLCQAQKTDTTALSTTILQDSLAMLTDSIATDSIIPKVRKQHLKNFFSFADYPNPKKAAIYSLIIPGAGQAYNKKFWKIPIVYAGIGTAAYLSFIHERRYRLLRDNYIFRVDGDPLTVDIYPNAVASTILSERNRVNKWRQQAYVALAIIWILNGIDAFVDGHLLTFDVNEDISGQLHPKMQHLPYNDNSSIGLGIVFSF